MANIQPTFGKWFPVALLVGALAGFSVYLTFAIGTGNLAWFGAPWVLFISWGAWFALGAKMHRMAKFIMALTGGTVLGWITVYLNNTVFDPTFGFPLGLALTVFVVATCIVLLELTSLFELAFIYFFSYAGYFAYFFGGFGKGASDFTSAVYFWILLMVGVLFAVVNVALKNALFNVERVPLDQRNTVFDKE